MRRSPKKVLVAATALVALAVTAFLVRDDPAPSGPPMLTAAMLETARHHGAAMTPDVESTRARVDQARTLAERFGPSQDNPTRRVVGVSFGTVGARPGWVIYAVHVRTHCFGGPACGPSRPVGTEIDVVDAGTLTFLSGEAF